MSTIPTKILIDTNIIIHLEDNKEIGSQYSELNRICGAYGITIFIHESSYKDIAQDADAARKAISLSKLNKYSQILRTPLDKKKKEEKFGAVKTHNDEIDTDLLVSLGLNVADILITEDKGLKARVRDTDLEDRVLNVKEALKFLKSFFDSVQVEYKHVDDKLCSQFHHDNIFFNSLKIDYPGFQRWYEEKCIAPQRPCWVIQHEGGIAGLIIYKEESRGNSQEKQDLDAMGIPGDKILKLCLFKIDENIRGEKFGEQLLKKAMDFAYRNRYDSIYLTTYPKHATLINLIQRFGFKEGVDKNGEKTFYKYTKVTDLGKHISNFDFHKLFWPCINTIGVDKYCVPVRPEFHDRLFPEAAKQFLPEQVQLQLFSPSQSKTPGNAIRKVYICNARTSSMNAGDILIFYRSGDSAVTSIGVIEEYETAHDFTTLKNLVGNRSVYSDNELLGLTEKTVPAKVVNFYYAQDLAAPIYLQELLDNEVLNGPPQSITALTPRSFSQFMALLDASSSKDIFYG